LRNTAGVSGSSKAPLGFSIHAKLDSRMTLHDLIEADHAVLRAAADASERLFVEERQHVGAAVRTKSGEVFSAIHFESDAAFATVCGEIAAISCMVAAGHRDLNTIVAVRFDPVELRKCILPPCGRCREVIRDFNHDAWVILSRDENYWNASAIDHPVKVRLGELLPRK